MDFLIKFVFLNMNLVLKSLKGGGRSLIFTGIEEMRGKNFSSIGRAIVELCVKNRKKKYKFINVDYYYYLLSIISFIFYFIVFNLFIMTAFR